MRLRDPYATIIDHALLAVGKAIEIKLRKAEETAVKPVFKGEIVALEPEFTEQDCIVAVRAYDKGYKLHGKRVSRTFQNQKAEDMVRQIGSEAGVAAGTLDATGVVHKFFQQSMETNWEFCWRLAAMNDFEFVVEEDKFHFRKRQAKSAAAHVDVGQRTCSTFRPRMSGVGQPKDVTVAELRPGDQAARVGPGRNGAGVREDGGVATAAAGSSASSPAARSWSADRVVADTSEAKQVAQSVLDRIAGSFVEAEGKAIGNPAIRAGSTLTITKVGKRFSGDYVLTQTTHTVRGGDRYTTSFVVSGRSGNAFADLLQTAQKAAWSNQLVVGVVTNNKDPDGMGRVRVKFPALGDTIEGWWARVATINAGNERGLFMLPEVNDEVVVAFEHGDTRRPIVIGSRLRRQGEAAGRPARPEEQPAEGGVRRQVARQGAHRGQAGDEADLQREDDPPGHQLRPGRHRRLPARRDGRRGDEVQAEHQGVRERRRSRSTRSSSVTIKGTGSVTVETSGALKLKGSDDRHPVLRPGECQGRDHQPRIGSADMAEILGSGIAFPLQVDRRGGIALASDETDVDQAIQLILATAPGERPMRPEFGCGVHDFVFDTIDAGHRRAHGDRDPRRRSTAGSRASRSPTSSSTSTTSDRGELLIEITYRLRATNHMRNLVYPFYVIPAEETAE